MPKLVPVDLHKIVISETSDMQVIVLRQQGGDRILPIWIGTYEAMAIRRRIQGEAPPRPMTHDMAAELVQKLGGALSRVVVDKFVAGQGGGTFHAKLFLRQGEKTIEIDARPSDAIALGVRLGAPIFVDDRILAEEGHDASKEPGPVPGGPGAEWDESLTGNAEAEEEEGGSDDDDNDEEETDDE